MKTDYNSPTSPVLRDSLQSSLVHANGFYVAQGSRRSPNLTVEVSGGRGEMNVSHWQVVNSALAIKLVWAAQRLKASLRLIEPRSLGSYRRLNHVTETGDFFHATVLVAEHGRKLRG